MLKICIIGTHGCGKSTLTYILAAFYKKMGLNVHTITEVARRCPFPINDGFSIGGAQWIIHTHIIEELEALTLRPHILICDRSPLDTVMYAKYAGFGYTEAGKVLEKVAENWMLSYDQIIWVSQPGPSASADGVRSTDSLFRNAIHDLFTERSTHPRTHWYGVSEHDIFNSSSICLDIDRHGIDRSSAKCSGKVRWIPDLGYHGCGISST